MNRRLKLNFLAFPGASCNYGVVCPVGPAVLRSISDEDFGAGFDKKTSAAPKGRVFG